MTEQENKVLYDLMRNRLHVLKHELIEEKQFCNILQFKKKKKIQCDIDQITDVIRNHTHNSSISLSLRISEWMLTAIGM